MLSEELQNFKSNMKQPWGILYYKLIWSQLADISDLKNKTILDFGSGFGTTANYLAKNNEVIAIEPNTDMTKERECDNSYTQINGKVEKLKDFGNGFFDVAVCHNVLEFAKERAEIVKEFSRVLKSGGILSVVKHNRAGRIMFKVIFENNIDEALNLLDGGSASNAFGDIAYYSPEDLTEWGSGLKIEKISGARILGQLHPDNGARYAPDWIDKLFVVEKRVCDLEPYRSVAFLHHVLLRKS
ncbi:MAG: methyltransferase domain-containing protein [Oscillospiraceae bacterium]|nr:methyltransferase domain-containing protein [Oscillospiraceae bacterium]